MIQTNDVEPIDRVREVVGIWAHNRKLYPGWLIFPFGRERSNLSHRTDEWELPILNAIPSFTFAEQLMAIREIVWRREILLDPITVDLEAAANRILPQIDCQNNMLGGAPAQRDDWPKIREAWIETTLALVTDARFDCNQFLFEQRLDSLKPFLKDNPEVEHRITQERCLWAVYSMDFELLTDLLDSWTVKNCDPIWMLRKAALLTEAHRYDDSISLIQEALDSIRREPEEGKSIASASREGWALASTLTSNNQQSISREWDKLASLKCDAGGQTDLLRRAITRTDEQDEAPSFNVGARRGTRFRFSNLGRSRLIAAYRVIRLLEVAGIPTVNNPGRDSGIPMSMVANLLTLAADELVVTNQQLAIRLVLRICSYDRDKTLERVLSRGHLARLTEETAADLARLCTGVIEHALPRLFSSDGLVFGHISWIERMRVALEVLSRLALRLPTHMVNDALDLGLECHRTDRVAQHDFLGNPLGNLLQRSWEALPPNLRAIRAIDLLAAPMVGLDNFAEGGDCPDPGQFVSAEDLTSEHSTRDHPKRQDLVSFLVRGLLTSNDARQRATLRLLPLVIAQNFTDEESSIIANALWKDSDPVMNNITGPGSPLDWVYFILPEVIEGQAEKSFRSKWLTSSLESKDKESEYSNNMLDQVGAAVTGLRKRGQSFVLSNEDEQYIASHIERLVEEYYSIPTRFNLGGSSSFRHAGLVAAEITIPELIAQNIFGKVERMIEPQRPSRDFLLGPIYDIRMGLGFAVIPGLVKALPEQFETLTLWLRTGLASEDDGRVRGAMGALQSWLLTETTSPMLQVPDDLVREVGTIIASDRRGALVDALVCAELVFDKGADSHRETLRPLALQGLSYLAEKLKYDSDEAAGGDVHTLRLLCARLATILAPYVSENDAAVVKWFEIGKSDPFPETRNIVMSYESR